MAWDGKSSIKCMANGVDKGYITANICDDEAMTPTIEIMTKHGSARVLTIDYILVRQFR